IETTGLDSATDEIISIGVVKSTNGEEIERLYRIIQPDKVISPKITDLTGLSQQKVEQEGISLEAALTDLRDFIGRSIVVGYNVAFDWGFIERGYDKVGQDRLGNRIIDLLKVVRQKEVFLDNFRFETVLKYYQIENQDQHNSLADAEATIKLMTKLIEKGFLKI
ncbi:MAG: PolC-type DNA polymerase III, partial [Limosilactobacillus fermentum]